ncbi:MFS transporter [Microbacteriaceae bacterium VKM Ac-2855]|nr:MFS transporter [Microbacteriaceae bacterium VKM Ac-2855]
MGIFHVITGAPPLSATNKRIFVRLMPLLMLCYFMSFLDRTNIGLAKERLEIDLGITAAAYGLGAGLFFLAYAVFEIPSNLILARVGARWWIFRIMITWGLLSAAMAFVQGETSFYIMRILLGIAEAGLFPGIMLYMTYWFRTDIRPRAIGMFLIAVCFSSIVGAPLGGALLQLDGVGGLHGWQWMFIVEGLPTVILAFFVLRYLPDRPSAARWLTSAESSRLESDLAAEQKAGADASGVHSFGAALKDRQMLLVIAIYWCHQVAIYSLIYFLPAIIGQGMTLTPLQVGLLTAIPWVAAAIGALVGPPRATTPRRSRNLVSLGLVGMFAGFLVGSLAGPIIGLIGFSFAAFFLFIVQPPLFTLPATRMAGAALAGGLGLLNTIGITGGFVGPYAMGLAEDVTGVAKSGLWLSMVLVLVGAVLARFLRFGSVEARADSSTHPQVSAPTGSLS